MTSQAATVTDLIKGHRYSATVTGKIGRERFYRHVSFIAGRDQTPEPFIRTGSSPDQDRVFAQSRPFGSHPILVVSGSIAETVTK